MLFPLSWLTLAPLVTPSVRPHSASDVPDILPPSLAAVRAVTDTATEPALVLLDKDVFSHYMAVRTEVFALIHKDAALTAFVQEHRQLYIFTRYGPGGMEHDKMQVVLPDFVALAAKTPAVAAIFKHHGFPPAQFAPVTIAIRKALFADALHKVRRLAIKDPQSIAGKNIAFIDAHLGEITGTGLDSNINLND